MADQFARQKSTRWVKADVPTYGDQWGYEYEDESDGYAESPQTPAAQTQFDLPAAAEPGNALVLLIDKLAHEDDDSEDEFESNAVVHEPAQEQGQHPDLFVGFEDTSDAAETTQESAHVASIPQEEQPAVRVPGAFDTPDPQAAAPMAQLSPELLPPTPTYQTRHAFAPATPETDISDRSYLSDADSIQREPASLNVRLFQPLAAAPQLSPIVSPENTENAPPLTLVLSIDRMNIADSDLSGDELVQAPSESDHDDWGYNSQHSSNFDEEDDTEEDDAQEDVVEEDAAQEAIKGGVPERHQVQTDALDSLINDLLKMEGLGLSSDTALQKSVAQNSDKSFAQSTSEKSAANNGALPTLDSIHDFSLPDFDNHSFSTDDEQNYEAGLRQANIPEMHDHAGKNRETVREVESQNDNLPECLSSVYSSHKTDSFHQTDDFIFKKQSIRKPPPQVLKESTDSDYSDARSAMSATSQHQSDDEPKIAIIPGSMPPPPILKTAVSRRESTMSNATFNMGSWKPNTGKFRDQFVNENDNESQMNVDLFSGTESVYNKFTGQSYAPSISNSSHISVPDTIDGNLHRIPEDDSDDDQPEVMTLATSQPFETFEPPKIMSDLNKSLSSTVLDEQGYDELKFKEEGQSPENTAKHNHEGQDKRVTSTGSGMSPLGTPTKSRSKTLYPVSDWNSIMSVSQPVDRINMLRKARQDEIQFETGLSRWLREALKSTESAPHVQIGKLASQAYQNAQHSDIRRHTSIRSKVSLVKDKMDAGNIGALASTFGRKFLSRGKKLMKTGSD